MGELERRPNAWALTPLVVFLLTYLVISIVAGDFYKMPITVAFVISSIVAIARGVRADRQGDGCRRRYRESGDVHPAR